MGIVINTPEAGIDYMLYGDRSNVVSDYLYSQMQALPQTFTGLGQRVQKALSDSYSFVTDKLTKYGIMSQITSSGASIADNNFNALYSYDSLVNANLSMQRYVMSHPQLKQLYVEQNIDGYSDTYVNLTGKDIGDNDYNYRMVMDGVLTSDKDQWVVKHYIQDLLPGDKELDFIERDAILSTWDTVNYILDTCNFDFTCKHNPKATINRS